MHRVLSLLCLSVSVCLYVHCSQFHFPLSFPSATVCSSFLPHAACLTSHSTQAACLQTPTTCLSLCRPSPCSPLLLCNTPPLLPVVLKIIVYDFLFEANLQMCFPTHCDLGPRRGPRPLVLY